MVAALLLRLRLRHATVYQELGEPAFQKRGSAWKVIKFVYLRSHTKLHDFGLSLLSDAMLVCFTLVILGYVTALLGYAGQPTHVAP
jgi:hypothetical protein